MKLSDIFGWLGNFEIMTLVRWWGLGVSTIFAFSSLVVLICLLGSFVMLVVSSVPWPLLAAIAFFASGPLALKVTGTWPFDDDFED